MGVGLQLSPRKLEHTLIGQHTHKCGCVVVWSAESFVCMLGEREKGEEGQGLRRATQDC